MKKFYIFDYAKPYGPALVDIINCWENDRGADGEENVFDLERHEDYKMFVDMFGIDMAHRYYEKHRYYFAGNNYPEPKETTTNDMYMMIQRELTLDYFRDAREKFGTIDYWGKYFNIEAINKWLDEPKGKYVIRHYWTQWVDIVVEAGDIEEAYILAGEKYNDGDYEENPENMENAEVQDVTEYYLENKIPF